MPLFAVDVITSAWIAAIPAITFAKKLPRAPDEFELDPESRPVDTDRNSEQEKKRWTTWFRTLTRRL